MPDLDKFERRLGKDWRRAYRLAKLGSPLPVVVDSLMAAAASALRGEAACPAVGEILHAFLEARHRMSQMDLGLYGSSPVQAHHWLCQKLEEIQQSYVGFPATRLAVRAALSLSNELDSDGRSTSASEVQGRLSEQFGIQLIDEQFLSRCRERLMKEHNRSFDSEAIWERSLQQQLNPQLRKLVAPMFQPEGSKAIRAPKSLRPKQQWSLEMLQRPIKTLVDAHE
jgi:hypothetical protein